MRLVVGQEQIGQDMSHNPSYLSPHNLCNDCGALGSLRIDRGPEDNLVSVTSQPGSTRRAGFEIWFHELRALSDERLR